MKMKQAYKRTIIAYAVFSAIYQIVFVLAVYYPVSYTHLDVYKRQRLNPAAHLYVAVRLCLPHLWQIHASRLYS